MNQAHFRLDAGVHYSISSFDVEQIQKPKESFYLSPHPTEKWGRTVQKTAVMASYWPVLGEYFQPTLLSSFLINENKMTTALLLSWWSQYEVEVVTQIFL